MFCTEEGPNIAKSRLARLGILGMDIWHMRRELGRYGILRLGGGGEGKLRNTLLVLARRGVHKNGRKRRRRRRKRKERYQPGWEQQQNQARVRPRQGARDGKTEQAEGSKSGRNKADYTKWRKETGSKRRLARGFEGKAERKAGRLATNTRWAGD